MVQCRICKGDHWTTHCPYKDTLAETGTLGDTDNGVCVCVRTCVFVCVHVLVYGFIVYYMCVQGLPMYTVCYEYFVL